MGCVVPRGFLRVSLRHFPCNSANRTTFSDRRFGDERRLLKNGTGARQEGAISRAFFGVRRMQRLWFLDFSWSEPEALVTAPSPAQPGAEAVQQTGRHEVGATEAPDTHPPLLVKENLDIPFIADPGLFATHPDGAG